MTSQHLRNPIAVLAMSVALAACLSSQEKQLNSAEKESIVQEAGRHLTDRYVFPDVGEKCAKHLVSRLSEGAFDSVSNPEEFAKLLTEELYTVARDKHLRIRSKRN